jgi:hypothetical protein
MAIRDVLGHLAGWAVVNKTHNFDGSVVTGANFSPSLRRLAPTSQNHYQLRVAGGDPMASENAGRLIDHGTREKKHGDACRGPQRSGYPEVQNKGGSHDTASNDDSSQITDHAVAFPTVQIQGFKT